MPPNSEYGMSGIKTEVFEILGIFKRALLSSRTIHRLLFKGVGMIVLATVSGYAAKLFALLPLDIQAQMQLELAASEVNLYKTHQIGTIKEVAMAQANLRSAEYSTNLINVSLSALENWLFAAIPLCILMLSFGVLHWGLYEIEQHYVRCAGRSGDGAEEHF
ncbi:conserved hypothetical protein [Vibrio crassostreae]|uniref:hypothetical protein n=1 Tax=Vibrio crassostreae TaxID=246167 RepID=UPI000C84E538|nr:MULTISPECIES: hypothetical protein [Vibrio]PMI01394.1 hypothetical protein BCU54_00355 [Vibrio lentus]CAK2847739.1 conserved hypothetical protein [Vibrio crassostreae]